MKRFVKTCLWLLLAGAVLSALLVAGVMQWAAPLDGATLSIDGEQFTFTPLQGGEWLLAIGAVVLAMIVVVLVLLLVVPFAVIVPLLCAALGIAVALGVLFGVLALLLSPLLLLAWIVWRLARSPSPARGPGATMSA